MASFVVMERRAATGSRMRDYEIVRDGFHVPAFVFPFFWLLFHRLWTEAAIVLVLMAGFAVLVSLNSYAVMWPLILLASLFFGFEASTLRLAGLRRAGWKDWGVVEAGDAAGAETRYAAETYGEEPAPDEAPDQLQAVRPETSSAPRAATGPALGLFSYPDGR